MGLKGITIETPPQEEAHINAADDRAIWEAVIGMDGVVDIGEKLKGTLISNNQFRIYDGALVVGGAIGRIPFGEYEDVTIQNGTQNQKRNDLIVAQIEANGSIENMKVVCIQGTPGETAEDPAYTEGNVYEGETLRQYPLYRVKLDGLNVAEVEQLFEVLPNISGLKEQVNELNSNLTNSSNKTGFEIMDTGLWLIKKYYNGYCEMWRNISYASESSALIQVNISVPLAIRRFNIQITPLVNGWALLKSPYINISSSSSGVTNFAMYYRTEDAVKRQYEFSVFVSGYWK